MDSVARQVAAPNDPKARLVSIFVGAVLLPSIALSLLSFYAVPKQAEATNMKLHYRAEQVLAYVEDDLLRAARERAVEAAQGVGVERLLDTPPEQIGTLLAGAGFDAAMFESLHFEASSRVKGQGPPDASLDALHDVLDARDGRSTEDVAPLPGQVSGVRALRFRLTRSYVRRHLLPEYFERKFDNPFQEMVVRVSDRRDGSLLYETAATPAGTRFEVMRALEGASFVGLTAKLRYRERSIEEEVKRWALAKTVLILFIDLMLGAGLVLVYSNVRREMLLSKLKSDFVANVSHELKTPLALIRLFSETLELGRVPSEDKKVQYYRVIHKESRRLTQLINNILDFSRIEAGRREYRFERTDPTRVVDEVLDAYRFQIEQQGFTLDVEIDDELPAVELDQEALGQALLNILNNAVKYSRERKHIKVAVRHDATRVTIAVSDLGIGIAVAEHDKVFEKFYRAEDSLVHETRGSGLGLALVRHIMEAHGGSVELESAPGQGSTFTLVLPRERPKRRGDGRGQAPGGAREA